LIPDSLLSEFGLQADLVYLNHAAVAPWPTRTRDALAAFADQNTKRGSLNYPAWLETEARLRDHLGRLINAPSNDDIALLNSTSAGLSLIAYGLDWREGDNVVISDQEFPSNRIVWESLRDRGVDCRQVDLFSAQTPEDALAARCDARTKLVSISSVQYATGLRLDLTALGRFCQETGILLCVDAIQSLGAVRMDVQAVGADFVVADGHKWMLGPEGVALFYCRAALRERLRLNQYGWHMTDQPTNFDRSDWRPAHTAQRFEAGSPNMLGIHALEASLSLLHEVGMENVESAVLAKSRHLIELLSPMQDIELVTPVEEQRRAGIVTFRPRGRTAEQVYQALADAGVFCALRGGGVRLSPHFYTPNAQLTRVADLIAQSGAPLW
jgi:cysteine desulfurase/selenocysteine lyase